MTNSNDLIHMTYGGVGNNDILFERCRIGSVWEGLGSRSWSYLVIWSPYRVIVRNCIFFAYTRGDFDRGIIAEALTEPDHALYVYNNVVADYAQRGISIPAAGAGLLRFEVFYVTGRLLYCSERAVTAGEAGKFEWPGTAASAVLLYRLGLLREYRPAAEVQGKVVLVR